MSEKEEHPGRWPVELERDLVGHVVCDTCNTSAKKWCDSGDYILQLEAERDELVQKNDDLIAENIKALLQDERLRLKEEIAQLKARVIDIAADNKRLAENNERLWQHMNGIKPTLIVIDEYRAMEREQEIALLKARVAKLIKENAELNAERRDKLCRRG